MAIIASVTIDLAEPIPGGGDRYGVTLFHNGQEKANIWKFVKGGTGPGVFLLANLDPLIEADVARLRAQDVEGKPTSVQLRNPDGDVIVEKLFASVGDEVLQEVDVSLPLTPPEDKALQEIDISLPSPDNWTPFIIGGLVVGGMIILRAARKRR